MSEIIRNTGIIVCRAFVEAGQLLINLHGKKIICRKSRDGNHLNTTAFSCLGFASYSINDSEARFVTVLQKNNQNI